MTPILPRRFRCILGPAAIATAVCLGAPLAQEPTDLAEATRQYERDVVENIQLQRVGRHTVRDLALPGEFLRRLADYEIRWSFHSRYHRVYHDVPDVNFDAPASEDPDEPAPAADWIRIHRSRTPASELTFRQSFSAGRPGLRGFRAPVLDGVDDPWPIELPAGAPEPLRSAAATNARRLARDGLLPTLARIIKALGPARYLSPDESGMATLLDVGVPVDLLGYFKLASGGKPEQVVASIARRLIDGATVEALQAELAGAPFEFVKTKGDFRVATESGEHDTGLVRLQLARGDYWRGPGCGDSVDMARQLAEQLPDVSLLVTLESQHLEAFLDTAGRWPHRRPGRLTVVAEPLKVTQWTQDNGKAGSIRSEDGKSRRAATLVPRFASKRNDGSEFIPGDSYLVDGLQAAGHPVFHSPLRFQGGNMLAVRDPATGERILLISEAEIYRNTVLGLSEDQVRAAFRVELAVDRCIVLPTIAFHLDYDLSARAHDGELVIFVNDTDAAVRKILELGIDTFRRAGLVGADEAATGLDHLHNKRDAQLVRLVAPFMWKLAAERDAYPMSVAHHFSAGAADSGIGNLQRFLVALDVLASGALAESELPFSPQIRSYLASFRRTASERRRLHERFESLGWRVEPVPSLAFAERSITYLNGLHDRKRYVMPIYGGFYEPLDALARAAFRRVLGPDVQLIGILSGESQRRGGAVHCSVAAYPGP